MTERDRDRARRFVPDILDAMQAIRTFTDGVSFDEFQGDLMMQYAVHYAFGIIGEAAKRVPPEVQAMAPEVDWRGMAGMRDFIVHSYDHVAPGIVWDTMLERFPIEQPALRTLFDDLDTEDADDA